MRPIFAVALLCLTSLPALAGGSDSTYTNHDFEACAAKRSPHPGVVDIRRCRGVSGIPVTRTAEPDASQIGFGRKPDATIPGLDGFHEARSKVEWRGPVGANGVRPSAAIVRYDTGASIGKLGQSRLVVHRLGPNGAACVMAVVSGSDANARARQIVDRYAAGFVCGRSAPIVRS